MDQGVTPPGARKQVKGKMYGQPQPGSYCNQARGLFGALASRKLPASKQRKDKNAVGENATVNKKGQALIYVWEAQAYHYSQEQSAHMGRWQLCCCGGRQVMSLLKYRNDAVYRERLQANALSSGATGFPAHRLPLP